MNCWNNLLVEAIARTGGRTGAFEDLTPLVAGVFVGLMGCSDLLGLTMLGETFL